MISYPYKLVAVKEAKLESRRPKVDFSSLNRFNSSDHFDPPGVSFARIYKGGLGQGHLRGRGRLLGIRIRTLVVMAVAAKKENGIDSKNIDCHSRQ